MRKYEPKRSICADCGAEITQSDEPWERGRWYDENVLDYDNPGTCCPETDDDHDPMHIIHEALEAADVLV